MSIEWTDVSGSGAVTAEEKMYPYVNPIEVSGLHQLMRGGSA